MPKFSFSGDFELEVGETLTGFDLSYQTFGKLNADKSNVVWIFHALTANCNPLDWWSGLVGRNKFITPDNYFIVCVNMPGSFYGSINPLSINNKTGKPFYQQFPLITIRDMANMYELLRTHLGIDQIYMGIGGAPEGVLAAAALRSIGGQMQGRLIFNEEDEKARAQRMGITDFNRKYAILDMAKGDVMFAATGVTDGSMLKGVKRTTQGATTHSIVMRSKTGTVRIIEAQHNFSRKKEI